MRAELKAQVAIAAVTLAVLGASIDTTCADMVHSQTFDAETALGSADGFGPLVPSLSHLPRVNEMRSLPGFERPTAAPAVSLNAPIGAKMNSKRIGRGKISHALTSSSGSVQEEATSEQIRFDEPSLAPMAFLRFCRQYPQDCTVSASASESQQVELTSARRAELASVNRKVNRAIKPQENFNGVMAEKWLISPRAGDCNDYAVTKRHELLARGWPSDSLLLAEAILPSGEHHLVLLVRTRENDLILDNMDAGIHPISRVRYKWVRAQQAKNPKFWSMVSLTNRSQIAMNNR